MPDIMRIKHSRHSMRGQTGSEWAEEYINLYRGGELKTAHVVDRVKEIGKRITCASGLPADYVLFFVTKEHFEFASALCPDTVIVTWGLYRTCHRDDQLAGVLAHEVSHLLAWLENNSASESSDSSQDMPSPRMGRGKGHLQLIHCVSDSNEDPDETEKLRASRQDEFEADRRAVGLLKDAGYNPTGLATYLWRDLSERFSFGMEDLFSDQQSTHPTSAKRIAAINQAAREEEFRDGERHGRGTYTALDGAKLVSKFKESLPDRGRHVVLAVIIGFLTASLLFNL